MLFHIPKLILEIILIFYKSKIFYYNIALTGNEVTSSNDTLLVSITRQNNSDIDLITVKNDSDGHDYFNTAVTDSDEENPTKNMKLGM